MSTTNAKLIFDPDYNAACTDGDGYYPYYGAGGYYYNYGDDGYYYNYGDDGYYYYGDDGYYYNYGDGYYNYGDDDNDDDDLTEGRLFSISFSYDIEFRGLQFVNGSTHE